MPLPLPEVEQEVKEAAGASSVGAIAASVLCFVFLVLGFMDLAGVGSNGTQPRTKPKKKKWKKISKVTRNRFRPCNESIDVA